MEELDLILVWLACRATVDHLVVLPNDCPGKPLPPVSNVRKLALSRSCITSQLFPCHSFDSDLECAHMFSQSYFTSYLVYCSHRHTFFPQLHRRTRLLVIYIPFFLTRHLQEIFRSPLRPLFIIFLEHQACRNRAYRWAMVKVVPQTRPVNGPSPPRTENPSIERLRGDLSGNVISTFCPQLPSCICWPSLIGSILATHAYKALKRV